jgi:HlyD family secretion protein
VPITLPAQTTLNLGVTGSGEVKALQDADLVFVVQGTVDQVLIEEGDLVKKGDLLAILDVRALDQQLQQAEASLAAAKAQEAALTEAPRDYDLAAAQAGLAQAQAALDAVRAGPKPQDIATAEAALDAARANQQATRDRLSLAKTQAELQMQQAVQALTQAQAAYAQAKYNWEYAQSSGNDPLVPEVTNAAGKRVENKLSDGQLENYYAQFTRAEAAMLQAEKSVEVAKLAFEGARQSEITGIAAAEAQTRQAELAVEKLKLPPDKDRLAAAQAGLAQANASRQRLEPNPRDSQKAQAAAGVAQAEAALELARINRERAELRAPFDGIIAEVNIDPGDPSSTGTRAAIRVVDVSKLHVDVQISDADIGKLKLGQTAEVKVDAAPGTVYTGVVGYIAPTATSTGVIRTFLVRIKLDSIDGLRAGMNARVQIKI